MKTPFGNLGNVPCSGITQETKCEYDEHGVVCLRSAFGTDWIEFLRDAVAVAMKSPGPKAEDYTSAGAPGRFFADLDLWQRIPAFKQFVFESPAACIAAEVMGANKINFFYDQVFVKEPGTLARTPWHQDQPYWAVSGRQVCTMWIPLDPVPRECGLEFVAGSHRWEAHNPHHFVDDTPYERTNLPELPNIDSERGKYDVLSWNMEPGDCLVFQAMIVHGAPGNSSSSRRRALAARWTGDDARYFVRGGEVAIPTSEPGLKHGDRLDCELFPVIYRRPI